MIEAGNPFSNPKDAEFFRRANTELCLKHARLVALVLRGGAASMSERIKTAPRFWRPARHARAVFGKGSAWQVREVLCATPEENLEMIFDTVRWLTDAGMETFFDAEHFFDGYKDNAEYAMRTLRAAAEAGARRLVLCDTNGGCFPDEIERITAEANRLFPG